MGVNFEFRFPTRKKFVLVRNLKIGQSMIRRFCTICLISLAMSACATFEPIELQATAIGKAPAKPYRRIYVMALFSANQEWLAHPLADGLSKALTSQGIVVESEFQFENPLVLAPGPDLYKAHAFSPDGILVCSLVKMHFEGHNRRASTGTFRCDLIDATRHAGLWSVKGIFEVARPIGPRFDVANEKIVQQLKNLEFI